MTLEEIEARRKHDEIKTMIIENFIDWFTHDDAERERMYESAELYVENDHVDEIGQAFFDTYTGF